MCERERERQRETNLHSPTADIVLDMTIRSCSDILNTVTENYFCVKHKMYLLTDYWM